MTNRKDMQEIYEIWVNGELFEVWETFMDAFERVTQKDFEYNDVMIQGRNVTKVE